MATSGPGAMNLVTAIADAKLDSVPLVAITGQVSQSVIGSDAFQETPTIAICQSITKHHYMITRLEDVARIVKEAFYVAASGRPGPVLIDFPKDVQLGPAGRDARFRSADESARISSRGAQASSGANPPGDRRRAARARRPILYVGGGVINADASDELRKFALRTGIPVTSTVMGLGAFPGEHPQSLHMLGMHGTVYANYAINEADLLLAFGVRFDDRVTGKLEEFAKHGKIVHVDVDPSEMHKNKEAHIPIVANVKDVLRDLNRELKDEDIPDLHGMERSDRRMEGALSAPLQRRRRRHPAAVRHRGTVAADERPRRRTSRSASASTRCGRPSSTSSRDRDTG